MRLRDFIRDRIFVYLSVAIAFAVMLMFLLAFQVSAQLIAVIGVILCLCLAVVEGWEYFRKKRFYDNLLEQMESLDQKYLISEMIEMPSFYEGSVICDLLHETGKSMQENVSAYRRNVSDFREFIEMWVHEIKLPISSLLLMAHNHKREFSSKALEQLRRIDSYTDTVLYYARAENAEKDYLIKETSLKRSVSNVAVKNREDLLLHQVQLETENLDLKVMTDGKWLEFILGQLLANSIRYISEGREAVITISGEEQEDKILLHFRDNGIGIPESDLPYLFEKSFTGENGRTHAKSTGMGLYIVKTLCDRLGHGITVTSERGEYTEVCISFARNQFYKFE